MYGNHMDPIASFQGFAPALPDILSGLRNGEAMNDGQDGKSRYDLICVEPCLAFIKAIAPRLSTFDPAHLAVAELGQSFRNRQENAVSTSSSHLSYLHLVFWAGEAALVSPTLHLVLSAGGMGIGAGQWQFNANQLQRYQKALRNAVAVEELVEAIAVAKKGGCHLEKPQLKTSDIDGLLGVQARQLALHTGLVVRNRNEEYPTAFFSAECIDMITHRFGMLLPLQKWLMKNVY